MLLLCCCFMTIVFVFFLLVVNATSYRDTAFVMSKIWQHWSWTESEWLAWNVMRLRVHCTETFSHVSTSSTTHLWKGDTLKRCSEYERSRIAQSTMNSINYVIRSLWSLLFVNVAFSTFGFRNTVLCDEQFMLKISQQVSTGLPKLSIPSTKMFIFWICVTFFLQNCHSLLPD